MCGGRMRGPCDAPPAPHLSDVTASGLISGAAQLPVSFPISALWGGSSLLGARQEEPSVQLGSGVELQPPWLCPSLCWPVAHPLPQCPSEDTRGAPVPLQPACPFPRSALGGAGTRPPSSLCLRKANTGTSCWGSSTPRAPPPQLHGFHTIPCQGDAGGQELCYSPLPDGDQCPLSSPHTRCHHCPGHFGQHPGLRCHRFWRSLLWGWLGSGDSPLAFQAEAAAPHTYLGLAKNSRAAELQPDCCRETSGRGEDTGCFSRQKGLGYALRPSTLQTWVPVGSSPSGQHPGVFLPLTLATVPCPALPRPLRSVIGAIRRWVVPFLPAAGAFRLLRWWGQRGAGRGHALPISPVCCQQGACASPALGFRMFPAEVASRPGFARAASPAANRGRRLPR